MLQKESSFKIAFLNRSTILTGRKRLRVIAAGRDCSYIVDCTAGATS